MLNIIVPAGESYDEKKNEFIQIPEQKLVLEHSLISVSKWESRWCKPFFGKKNEKKSLEETKDYIRCMLINSNVSDDIIDNLPSSVINEIVNYIESPMTATKITDDDKQKNSGQFITSELIYYWMASFGIPFECEKWHLNRLITLIKIFQEKSKSPKKVNTLDEAERRRALNNARRSAMKTRG